MNDRILTAYLNEFVEEFGYQHLSEADAFELFTDYFVVSKYSPEKFEPDEVSTGGRGDLGIDGIGIIVNDHLIHSCEDVDYFRDLLHRLDVRFVFVQAKTSPHFEGGDIGTFISGVREFFSSDSPATNERVLSLHDMKEHIYDRSIDMDKSPVCTLYFVTTGTWNGDPTLSARIDQGKRDLLETRLFSDVEFIPLDADGLRTLHQEMNQRITRQIRFDKHTILPEISGVEEAYIGILPCTEYLKLISDDYGNLNRRLFYDNVRDFQGRNAVNQEIEDTIQNLEQNDRFALLNNGVTIVAGDLSTVGANFRLRDYQIVNGCQTSHIIFNNKDRVTDSIFLPVKVIVTREGDVINQIIQGTNRQTEVKIEAFESLAPFQKQLEELYIAVGRGKRDPVYYERRSKQYDQQNVRKDRIITLTTQIKSFVAMFLNEPHSVHRYYGELLNSYRARLFRESHSPMPYYLAGASLCTVERLFYRGILASDVRPFKYALLMAFRIMNEPFDMPHVNNHRRIDTYCQKIAEIIEDESACESAFLHAAQVIRSCQQSVPRSRDPMERTRAFTSALMTAAVRQSATTGTPATVSRVSGRVDQFSDTLGWGFIRGADNIRYFVHYTDIFGIGFRSLDPGEIVEFTPTSTERGPKALDVTLTE